MCFISIITPCCVFVLVALPERIQYPAEVRAPAAVAKTRIAVSETRPQFGKRILEERRPLTQTHVNDDWFVLLDVGIKESGICFFNLFVLGLGFFLQTNGSHVSHFLRFMKCFCSLLKGHTEFSCVNVSADGCAHSLSFNDL